MQTHAAANISVALAKKMKKKTRKKGLTHVMCTHVLPDVTKNTHQNTAKKQEAVIKKTRGERRVFWQSKSRGGSGGQRRREVEGE